MEPTHPAGIIAGIGDFDMARGLPSMTALLGLLAIAGYQNRDKIAEMLKGAGGPGGQPAGGQPGGQGGLGGLLGGLAGTSAGGLLGGGLGSLLDSFRQAGQGDVADSWVSKGPNKPIEPPQIKQAIGADVLSELAQRTGLSEEEILNRLSQRLPDAVDKYTPDGRLPQN
jgi:uncharacterized protein YidB (DUF937 family)